MRRAGGYGVRGGIGVLGKLKGAIVIVGLVAAYALWLLPTLPNFASNCYYLGPCTATTWTAQWVTFGSHVGAVLCLVVALFCAANLVLRWLERTWAPRA